MFRNVVLAGAAAMLLFAGYVHERDQRAAIDALTREAKRAHADDASSRDVDRPAAPAIVVAGPAGVDGPSADAIAARVADVLEARAKADRTVAATATSAGVAADGRVPTPQELAASDDASKTLDDAIVRGHLRKEDIVAMRRDLSIANDPATASALARRVAVAINTGAVVPEDAHYAMP
jgi:hypothetical protein